MEIGMPGGSAGWGGAADEQHKDVLARLIHRRDVEGVRRRRSERDRVPRDPVEHRPEDEAG